MKDARYDFILPFFCGEDKNRPSFMNPCQFEDGNIYATDGTILIRTMIENVTNHYKKEELFQKSANKLINSNIINCSKRHIIKTETLIQLLSRLKWHKNIDYKNCDTCNGSGEVECDYGHLHECPDCSGDGEKSIGISEFELLKCENNYHYIKIQESVFKANYIHILAIVAKIFSCDEIQYFTDGKNDTGKIFKIEDAEILLMPNYASYSDEVSVVKLEK